MLHGLMSDSNRLTHRWLAACALTFVLKRRVSQKKNVNLHVILFMKFQ